MADYINKSLFVMEEVNLILSIKTIPASNEVGLHYKHGGIVVCMPSGLLNHEV